MTSHETIGQRIRRLRLARGIRFQKDLAGQVGIDPASLNQIEQGYRVPKLATIDKLALALGVTRDAIIDGDAKPAAAAPPPAAAPRPPDPVAAIHKPPAPELPRASISRIDPAERAEISALIRSTIQEEIRGIVLDIVTGVAGAVSTAPKYAEKPDRQTRRSGTHGGRARRD